jgi:hypothetical protein
MCLLFFVGVMLSAGVARAQSIGLPKMDSISFYGEVSDFESREAHSIAPVVVGWGFETAFTVASAPSHTVELALGYDNAFEHAQLRNGAVLDGELRSLPSISVYLTLASDVYIGLGTGVVSLTNASLTTPAAKYPLGGDTFDASARLGYSLPLEPSKALANRRAYAFVEADYHVRYFGGLSYSLGAPPETPSRMYLGGASFSLGLQVMLDAATAKAATVKK